MKRRIDVHERMRINLREQAITFAFETQARARIKQGTISEAGELKLVESLDRARSSCYVELLSMLEQGNELDRKLCKLWLSNSLADFF